MKRANRSSTHNVVILLVLMLTLVLSLVSGVSRPPIAQAQGQPTAVGVLDKPCVAPTWAPTRAIPLIPNIPPSDKTTRPRGEFKKVEFTVILEGSEQLCLASTPDGRGKLQVDDYIDFQVSNNGQLSGSWQHDFHSFNYDGKGHEGIGPSEAQNVTVLFKGGTNSGIVRLVDFFIDSYSAWPVYLVIWSPATPTPTMTPTFSRTPTLSPTATKTATPTITPIPPPTPMPTPAADIKVAPIPPFEQGQVPPRFSVKINTKEKFTATASIKDSRGRVIQRGIALTKQEEEDTYELQISAIDQPGTYSLVLHIDYARGGNKDESTTFEVEELLWWRTAKVAIPVLVIAIVLFTVWWKFYRRVDVVRLKGSLIDDGGRTIRLQKESLRLGQPNWLSQVMPWWWAPDLVISGAGIYPRHAQLHYVATLRRWQIRSFDSEKAIVRVGTYRVGGEWHPLTDGCTVEIGSMKKKKDKDEFVGRKFTFKS